MDPDFEKLINKLGKARQDNSPALQPKILLVDAMNTFLRSFAIINHMNPKGNHIGGLTGFLKSMGYAIKQLNPTRVIVVFEGEGSTNNKKNLYPDYKGNRKIKRITNFSGFDSQEDESESIESQLLRLDLAVDLATNEYDDEHLDDVVTASNETDTEMMNNL